MKRPCSAETLLSVILTLTFFARKPYAKMICLMSMFLLARVILSTRRIPFGYTYFGFPYVNISLPGLFNDSSIPFVLVPIGQSEVLPEDVEEDSLWNQNDQELVFVSTRDNRASPIRFVEPQLLVDHGADLNHVVANLGIGPDSAFIDAFASVDFLTDIGELVVGSSPQQFFSACSSGNILRVPILGIGPEMYIRTNLGDDFMPTRFTGANDVLGLPPDEFGIILRILEVEAPDFLMPVRFDDCARRRSVLPELTISIFSQMNERTGVGSIVLYPDDYTHLKSDGSCELLIGRLFSIRDAVINPLRIPHVNVRFTYTEAFFCDSLD